MLDFCVKLRSRCLIICFHWSAVAYDKDGILIDFYVGWRLQELIWNGKSPPQPVWHFLFCCSEYRILDFRHPRAYEYPIHRNTFSYCHLQHRDERRVQSSSRSFFSYWPSYQLEWKWKFHFRRKLFFTLNVFLEMACSPLGHEFNQIFYQNSFYITPQHCALHSCQIIWFSTWMIQIVRWLHF